MTGVHVAPAAHPTREQLLLARLQEDPNDVDSFRGLVRLLAPPTDGEPGSGAGVTTTDDTTWALAAELAQHPRAWYPLVQLARLGLDQDPDTAAWRLAEATVRDDSGRALTAALALLRTSGHPDEAFRLALARWRPDRHEPATGREFALAAVEAHREREFAGHLDALSSRPGGHRVAQVRAALERHRRARGGASPARPRGPTDAAGRGRLAGLTRFARRTRR